MAGGLVKYRHLSRDSSARQALLRGLVTQLVHHEHIMTTHAKAKEAQRLAEKLITLAKRDNETSRRSAQGILYEPHQYLPKLFGQLKERYATREGGYTRVVRTEPRSKLDQAETSILEFVDGPKDTRFMMTAKTVARDRLLGRITTPVTEINVKKVTQFRGQDAFENMVQRFMMMSTDEPPVEEDTRKSDRPHWEPKLANLKMPKDIPTKKAMAASPKSTMHEIEASQMAALEQEKTELMGDEIVPKKAKARPN